jgi:ATP-dependent helicase HrpB
VKLIRFIDLVIHHEHQREVDPAGSGRCLAEAYVKGYYELPLFTHDLKQFIARVNLVNAVLPELEFPAFDSAALVNCLARAFNGLTLVKEVQGTHLTEAIRSHLAKEQLEWLQELAPVSLGGLGEKPVKLTYPEAAKDEDGEVQSPEAQVKLHEHFSLREHPRICEGKLPVKLWLAAPDGKRLEATYDFAQFKSSVYPRLKSTLQKKYPGVGWL